MVQVVLEDAKTQDKPAITPGPEPGLPSLTAREIEKKLQESEDRSHATFRGNIIFLILYLVLRSDLI